MTVTNVSEDENDIRWQDNSNNEFGFYIRRFISNDDGDLDPDTEFSVGPNATFFADSTIDAEADIDYVYQVSAYNAAGESGASESGDDDSPQDPGTTNPESPTVAAPSRLQGVVEGPNEVDLSWYYDESENVDQFVIMRAETDNPAGTDFTEVGSTDGSTLSFTDSTVVGDTDYTYYVYATYQTIASSPSNQAQADTSLGLDAPAGLTAEAQSTSAINVSWNQYTGGANSGFELDVTDPAGNVQTITISDSTATSYVVTDLQPSTAYTFVLKAIDSSDDESDDSNSADATTDAPNIDTLTVSDANPDADSQSVDATADDPEPSTPLTVTLFCTGGSLISLSATELGNTPADSGALWEVMTSDGEQVSYGTFGNGNVTVPLANDTSDTAEFIVSAGYDTDGDGELSTGEITRTVTVDVPAVPQITSLTADVPNLTNVQATADSPDGPVDLYVPEALNGHATIELTTDLAGDTGDSSDALWKVDQSEGGASPASGNFADGSSGVITLAPDGGKDFVVTAWYDANGDGIADQGESTFEIDVHVVALASLTATDDADQSQTVTSSSASTSPTLNLIADSDGNVSLNLNALFGGDSGDPSGFSEAAALISYQITGEDSSGTKTFAAQTSDDSAGGVLEQLAPGVDGGTYTITAWEPIESNSNFPTATERQIALSLNILPSISISLNDDSPNQILEASSDGTQNLVPLHLTVPNGLPDGTQIELSVSAYDEVDVWDTANPTNNDLPIIGTNSPDSTSDYRWIIGSDAVPATLYVGATQASEAVGDITFTLTDVGNDSAGSQVPPTTSPSVTTKPATAESNTVTLVSDLNDSSFTGANVANNQVALVWVVGQTVDLKGSIGFPGVSQNQLTYTWTLQGMTLYGWAAFTDSGAELQVPGGNGANGTGVNQPELKLFWENSGMFSLTLTVTGGHNQKWVDIEKFNVESPEATFIGTPAVLLGWNFSSNECSYGDIEGQNGAIPTPGMTFDGSVTANSIEAGQFEFVQLVQSKLSYTPPEGGNAIMSNTDGYLLDDDRNGDVAYGGDMASVNASQMQLLTDNDSPDVGLAGKSALSTEDDFHDYLMYQPTNGNWVPLQEFDWSITAAASLNNSQWSFVYRAGPTGVINGAAPTGEPIWAGDFMHFNQS